MNQPILLVIDDEPNNFDVIETFLSHQDYDLHYVSSGADALALLKTFRPDLILLDVMMPNMDGMEVCQRIKELPDLSAVPIVMVTALTSKQDLARCFDVGADDFISKPVNRLELVARVRSMLRIYEQQQQLTLFNNHLESMVQQRTSELRTVIYQDHLTRLPSRNYLYQRLEELLQTNVPFALVSLDCDQFKLVNGSFGHGVGDRLLVAIAQRLEQHLSSQDLLVRMGEDEFCFLLHPIDNIDGVEAFVQRILGSFSHPFPVSSFEIFTSVCAGVALSNHNHTDPDAILQDADTAMYQAKAKGKGSYQVFDSQMHQAMLKRLTLENDLQHALENEEFVLFYQPIIHLSTRTLAGFEALIRWPHPLRGMVSPAEFIPSVETTGLIVPLGIWVLRQACQQLQTWHQQGFSDLTMSINLSVRQFSSPTLLADVDRVLEDTGVNPAFLKLEITESAIMENAETAIALTAALQARGIQISIDDFGTGYSSLGYLHRFPVNTLKIDRSFINQIQSETCSSYPVVDTILTLSQQLNLSVVAEGIETPQQAIWLGQKDCAFGQGYFFSKPLPAEEIETRYFAEPPAKPLVTPMT